MPQRGKTTNNNLCTQVRLNSSCSLQDPGGVWEGLQPCQHTRGHCSVGSAQIHPLLLKSIPGLSQSCPDSPTWSQKGMGAASSTPAQPSFPSLPSSTNIGAGNGDNQSTLMPQSPKVSFFNIVRQELTQGKIFDAPSKKPQPIRCDGDSTGPKNLQEPPRSNPGGESNSNLAQYLRFKQIDQ